MSESRDCSDANGSCQQQKTETSPLKQNDLKQNWLSRVFLFSGTDNDQGSLKTIVINFFVFTVFVTLGLLVQIYYGGYENKPHGSVASDSLECSQIGIKMLKMGGNSVDAAIASTFCLGVVNFHITGLGGGGHMLIYNHIKRKIVNVIDFQASLPISLENKELDVLTDGLTVGVPGLLMGLWDAHQKYGRLQWEELIRPAADLARYGFIINDSIMSAQSHLRNLGRSNENLVKLFNSLRRGENTTFPELAATLDLIAASGPDGIFVAVYSLTATGAFYNGSIARDITYSVQKANGNMTLNDISQYQIFHNKSLRTRFGNFDIFTTSSSSGGALLLNALDTIQILDLSPDDDNSSIILRLSDVLHDTYVTFLQKNNANPFPSDPAASQVSVIDNGELYVSVVTGLNTWLGSQILTETGFILNNAVINGGLDDKGRPVSLSAPVIALETDEICGKRFILGSGDATVAAQVLTEALILNKNLNASIELPRFLISNVPRLIRVEDFHSPFYDPKTIKKVRTLLKIERAPLPYNSVNGILKEGDRVTAHSDTRGRGSAVKF